MSQPDGPVGLPRHLERADQLSRQHWAMAIAGILIQHAAPDVLEAISACGEQEFARVARPILRGHALKREDYRLIYEAIQRRVARLAVRRDLAWR